VLAETFTLLFYVTDTLPMTVPVAAVVIIREATRLRGRIEGRAAPQPAPATLDGEGGIRLARRGR
jgi:hypothetical protein